MRTIAMVFILTVSPTLAMTPGQPPSPMPIIDELRAFSPQGGRVRLNELLVHLDQALPQGVGPEWPSLRALVQDPQLPIPVRASVLKIVMKKADARVAADIILDAAGWAGDAQVAMQDPKAARSEAESHLLFTVALGLTEGDWPLWSTTLDGGPELIRLLGLGVGGQEARSAALRALAESPAARAERRLVAEAIVLAQPEGGEVGPALALLDEASIPTLREALRTSGWDPLTFHFGCAKVLAHLGDQESLPDLRSRKQHFLSSPSPDPRSPNLPMRASEVIDGLVLQIELQNPPDRLLTFIESTEGVIPPSNLRPWAVRRAVELGVAPAKVRQAILAHAAALSGLYNQGQLPSDPSGWPPLQALKEVGFELNVLTASDLEHVRPLQRLEEQGHR